MKNSSRSLTPVASALALAVLVIAGACNTTQTPDAATASGQSDQEVAATIDPRTEWLKSYAAAEAEATPEATPAPRPPAKPPAAARADDDDLAARAKLAASLSDERLATLVEGFIDEGLVALDDGEIERAHKLFADAWRLDPTNAVARDLYHRTGALTGDDAAGLGALAADARTLTEVRQQQRSVDIDHHLSLGRNALAADAPEKALQHFEDALTLIRFNPDAARGTATEDEVLALIGQAEQRMTELAAARDEELARRAQQAQEEWDYADRNRTALRVAGLISIANDAFLRDEFDNAVVSLDEALSLDPENADASELRRIAVKAGQEQMAREIRRTYRKQWNRTFDDMRHDTVVPNDLITFPDQDSWSSTIARGPRSFAATAGGMEAGDQALADLLDDTRMPYEWDGNTLTDAIENLKQVTGVNFLMSQGVREEADNQSYTGRDRSPQPVSRILRMLLEDQSTPPMTYAIRDGIVRIMLQDESVGDYLLEMYDIRDVINIPSDYPAEDFNLLPSGTDAESFQGVEDEEPLPVVSPEGLMSLILDNIAPLSWTEDEQRSISLLETGTMIVRQTPDVHEQIHELLDHLRHSANTLINIETRFVSVEDSFLEDIGVDLRGLDPVNGSALDDFGQPFAGTQGSIANIAASGVGTPSDPTGIGSGTDAGAFYSGNNGDLKGRTENLFDAVLGESGVLTGGGGLSLEALFLDDTNLNAVLRAVTKYQNSNIVNAPSLTLRSGQRGNIKVLENRTYVRDFEPEIATGAVIAQPELGIVKSGVTLDVRAVASADRRFITLEVRPTVAELVPDRNGNLLREELVSLGTPNANNVTLHLPELAIQRVRTTSTVPDGGTLLLGGLKNTLEQDQSSTVPFLGDIPILGFFFSRNGEYSSRRKLLILLTVTIVAPEEHEPDLR